MYLIDLRNVWRAVVPLFWGPSMRSCGSWEQLNHAGKISLWRLLEHGDWREDRHVNDQPTNYGGWNSNSLSREGMCLQGRGRSICQPWPEDQGSSAAAGSSDWWTWRELGTVWEPVCRSSSWECGSWILTPGEVYYRRRRGNETKWKMSCRAWYRITSYVNVTTLYYMSVRNPVVLNFNTR